MSTTSKAKSTKKESAAVQATEAKAVGGELQTAKRRIPILSRELLICYASISAAGLVYSNWQVAAIIFVVLVVARVVRRLASVAKSREVEEADIEVSKSLEEVKPSADGSRFPNRQPNGRTAHSP